MTIEIREARPEDAPAMGRLMVKTWLKAHKGQIPDHLWQARVRDWTPEVSERGWRRTIAAIEDGSSPHDVLFLATDGEQPVGIGGCDASMVESRVNVHTLYVSPEHQRKQIGRRLFEAIEERYSTLGLRTMEIGVLAANRPARHFYEAMGGSVIAEREFDEEGEMLSLVVYGWDLGAS